MIAPLLDEIAREKVGLVTVARANVDENQSLWFKYRIRAIPALLFFKNSQLRDQVAGVTSKKICLAGSERRDRKIFAWRDLAGTPRRGVRSAQRAGPTKTCARREHCHARRGR